MFNVQYTRLISVNLKAIGWVSQTNLMNPKPVQPVAKLDHCKLHDKISDQRILESISQITDPFGFFNF